MFEFKKISNNRLHIHFLLFEVPSIASNIIIILGEEKYKNNHIFLY